MSLTLLGQLLDIQSLEEILDSRFDIFVSLYLDLAEKRRIHDEYNSWQLSVHSLL